MTDPATEDVIAEVADGSVQDALDAVEIADLAMPGWAATPPRERGEILRRAFELMTERSDWLAELIVAENGKSFTDSLGEVKYAAEFFRWFAEECVRVTDTLQTAPAGTSRTLVVPQPIGVALLITPWNFPAAMATRKIGPALAAGCTVILKPASETPLSALAIGDVLAEAGVPDGVVNVLPSRRSGAVCLMRNGGEACTAANRFYVQSGIAAQFSRELAAAMAALRAAPVRIAALVNAEPLWPGRTDRHLRN